MQIFITDNRYAPGSSHSDLPYDALAAYSARWLDRGSGVPADVLPDRQGIAWDHDQYKVILLGELPMLSLDQLADLAWDKVPTEAEHASIIEHFRSTPPESAYAQARHYMLTKRLAERYPDEYSGVTG